MHGSLGAFGKCCHRTAPHRAGRIGRIASRMLRFAKGDQLSAQYEGGRERKEKKKRTRTKYEDTARRGLFEFTSRRRRGDVNKDEEKRAAAYLAYLPRDVMYGRGAVLRTDLRFGGQKDRGRETERRGRRGR